MATRDLMKRQLIGTQAKSPAAPIGGAATVTVNAEISRSTPTGTKIRRKLWGRFADGTERVILTHTWPDDGPVTVADATAMEVWTEIVPVVAGGEPVNLGEVITTN